MATAICTSDEDCETDGLGCTVDVCLGGDTCQRTPAYCPTDYTCIEPICQGGCGGCTEEASCSQSDCCSWTKDPGCDDTPCGERGDESTCTFHGCTWSNEPVACDTKDACNSESCSGCSWSNKNKICLDDATSSQCSVSAGGQCTGPDPTPCVLSCHGIQEPFTCQPPPPQCREAGVSCVDDVNACCAGTTCNCWTKGKKAGQCQCQ